MRLSLLVLQPQVNDFLSIWFVVSVLWRVLCEFESNHSISQSKVCILTFQTNVCVKIKDSSDGRNGMYFKEER